TPCCNLTDCRPTSGKRVDDHYEVKVNGTWVSVPPSKILKQSAPGSSPSLSRIVVLINPVAVAWSEVFRRIEVLAPSLGVQLTAAPVKNSEEIERAINEAARSGAGLIAFPGSVTAFNRAQIVALTARHRLPAIYPYRYFVTSGGVMSY